MNSFKEHMAEDRRLCILRLLSESQGRANDSMLQTALDKLGHRRISRSAIRADIQFLAQRGLVSEEWVETILVATITERGVDVAEGREEVEGIKKPAIWG